MAAVTSFYNNVFPFMLRGLPWVVVFPILDNTGALVTGAAGLDSERSLDGDTPADCTNEATEIGSSGMYYLILTAAETSANVLTVITKTSTTNAKTTPMVFYPQPVKVLQSGTCAGGASSYADLDGSASTLNEYYRGFLINVTIDGVEEYRWVNTYTASLKRAFVSPNWVTAAPDSNDPYAIIAYTNIGIPDVNAQYWNTLTTVELPLVPTTAGRKLDVSTGGEAGLDWANIGSPTTTQNLTNTTVKTADQGWRQP